jgi:hypothetical protein
MTSDNRASDKSPPTLGFLTVLEHETDGLFGGYLILNMAGRPLEFHCTAPIRANRAQEILYGPTLQPYLYGEQIGQTLLDKAKVPPLVVCTDRPAALAVREWVDVPVALVVARDDDISAGPGDTPEAASAGEHWRVDAPHIAAYPLCHFRVGSNRLAVAERSAADRDVIAERLRDVADSFDLAEPFCRIREAIEEARGGGPRP